MRTHDMLAIVQLQPEWRGNPAGRANVAMGGLSHFDAIPLRRALVHSRSHPGRFPQAPIKLNGSRNKNEPLIFMTATTELTLAI